MSNPRGASGANKSRLHNVNSVYSGKNTAATKASGPGKHGLQPLGKATAVVRRMPPPATLPSLKAEHGQDPLISIVPQGGTGWTTKSSSTETEKHQNGSPDLTGGNAPDLRPTWAKNSSSTNSSTPTQGSATENSNSAALQTSTMTNYSNSSQQSSQGTAAQIVQGTAAAPPNNRDFPSLAASVAAVTGSKSSDTGSLKPQKASAWGTNLADANVEIPHIPVVSTQQSQSGGYIGASTAPKPHVERIIPSRYISSQPPISQSKVAAKIGIREKLARFSMESKEPSVDAENKAAATEQATAESAKQATESPVTTESSKEIQSSVAPQQQPPIPTAPVNHHPHHQFSQPPPQLRSQDVRQLQPSQFPIPDQQQQQQPPSAEWQNQDRFVNGAPPYNNYDQQQKLLQNGRGEGGYGGPRGMPPQQQQQQHGGYPGGGIVGQQRFDERGNPYGERQIEELGWGDDLPIDNRRGMISNNQQNRNNRYRIDSRSSTEADNNTWQGPPQHYGQQQQVGGPHPPRQQQQQMPPQNAGWYDNSGYPLVPPGQDYNNPPAQYPSGNNNYSNQRSRNSSVATDYNNYDQQQQQHQKGPPRRHQEFDYRQQGYQGGYPPSGGQNYHESQQHHGHEQHRNMPPPNRQPQQQQHPPPQQQHQHPPRYQQPDMPYRMLKRNDEKSAEYIAHHGGGPILQQQQQSSTEEEVKPKTKESKSRSTKGETESETAKAATIPPAPKENVWEKRMEERKKEVIPKANSRFQQELDYNFPSINDVPKDISEWNPPPPPPPPPASDSKNNSRKGPRRNDSNGQYQQQPREQRPPRNVETAAAAPASAVPLDAESIGSSHWVQEKTGPSWDNLSIPADHRPEEPLQEEDDVYTGTKREFVNSKRSRGGQFNKAGDFASRDIRPKRGDSSGGGIVNGKKPVSSSSSTSSKPAFDSTTKRPSRTDDNFSNMGEFHAEDYKIPEEAATPTTTTSSSTTKKPYRSRDNNTFESNEGYDSSRRGSKRGVARQPRGNNNWKGSERLPRSNNSEHRETGNEEHFERYDTSASSASMRGNGRRLAPMGGNGRGSSRFLSKHTNKPTRHKPAHFEGGNLTAAKSSSNRASADRNVEGLKSPAASEGVDEWETASESSDVGGRDEPSHPQPPQEQQRERKNLTNGIRSSTKYQTNDTNSISSNSKEPSSQSDEISSATKSSTTTATTRTNQKNVNPASHTYLGNGVSAKSSNAYNNKNNSSNGIHQPLQQNNNKHRFQNADTPKAENIKENARDNRKGFGSHNNGNSNSQTTSNSIHMGLAGVDINDASVIVIDNQPDIISRDFEFNSEEAGDFEEVLSKKQKKLRLIQVEEERRKEQKEREKAEKIQAKKKQALQQKQQQRADKNFTRKSQEKTVVEKDTTTVPPVVDSKKVKPIIIPSKASPIRKNIECDLGTSIWNNTLTAAANSNSTTIVEKPHIPSPIARPTKSQTIISTTSIPSPVIPPTVAPASSLTVDVNAVKEDFETFTIATSTTVTTATTSACYDFAYDSTLKSASPIGVKSSPKLSQEVQKPTSDGVELNSDHVQLKEKLEKIKDFWPGQTDFERTLVENGHIDKTSLSQAHGPNVAKVKPQPQHHDSSHQQQHQQVPFIAPEAKQPKSIETFNAFTIPPSQSPNLYQRGGNAVFTMGPTSPFRQISSNHQIYSMPAGYGSNDYIQQQQHYHNGHTNSPTNQTFYGGAQIQQQQQPSRPQSFDGMFNSNQLWNSNGIDILSTITPPLQQQQPQQINQARYISNSRPPSHPSTNVTSLPPPNAFPPPTHLPPPPPHMGYPQQQPFQQQPNTFIPTHIPPPPLQHTYIELMNGPPPPPPIGATRSNNGNSRTNLVTQPNQQNNNNSNYRQPQMQILRPQQFNNNNFNGVPSFPLQQHQQQQFHQMPLQQYQQNGTNGVSRNNNQQNRGQIQQQQQNNWQKQDQQPFHIQQNQQQNLNGHPSNFGGYFNIKYSTTNSTTNQPTAMPSPTNGAISRSALIERLMKENVLDENSSEPVPLELEGFSPRRRSWNEFSVFLQDNLAEVEQKLSQIETQIWGKLIVMERNFRTAKAYLRNSTIIIDGGSEEFDGIKIGLSQFHNERRDPRTEMELKFFGKGIKIQLDSNGNLWMKRNCDRRISVRTRQRRDPIILGDEYRKIFDLRIFKESILTSLNNDNHGLKGLKNSSSNLNKRLKESALIFLRFGDIPSNPSAVSTKGSDYLEAPLWSCLIHLIAFDMIGVIISEFNESPRNSLQSFESHSCSTSTEESSASSSSYLPSNNSNSNNNNNNINNNNNRQNNNKTGVARRIFQQRKPNHYQSPFAFEEALNKVSSKLQKPRSRSQTRIVPLSALPAASRPIENSSAMNGWSLLNLSDIDKLRTPAYFASSEEAGAHRQRGRPTEKEFDFGQKVKRRGKSKTPKDIPQPPLPPVGLTKYKWLSETCIKNVS